LISLININQVIKEGAMKLEKEIPLAINQGAYQKRLSDNSDYYLNRQDNFLLGDQFKHAMQKHGIYSLQPIFINGQIHRFANQNKGNRNCWYFLYPEGYGYFGDWSRGIKEKFISQGSELNNKQNELIQTKLNELKEKKRELQLEVADEALLLWNSLADNGESAYIQKKQVGIFGIKFDAEGTIYVPIRDITGKLWSLQKIYTNGNKQFFSGGRKYGCFHLLGNIELEKPLYIAEGYATAVSIHMATNEAVIVAFDAGNLDPVIAAIRAKYPALKIIIAADNDCWIDQNIGKIKAEEAAKKHNCTVIIPNFTDTSSKPTDYNDLHMLEGLTQVKKQLGVKEEVKIPYPFSVNNKGVFYSFTDKKGDEQIIRLASPILVKARVCDEHDQNHGFLLNWQSTSTNKTHSWCLPARLFATDKASVIARLLDEGVTVTPGNKWQEKLLEYIQLVNPGKLQLCTTRVGWHDNAFILPDKVYPDINLVLQAEHDNFSSYGVKGTLSEWQENIAKYARGNSRLILALAAAFASPLLKLIGEETGGIHFVGSSSIGKTTMLRVAASVFGPGSDNGYIKQWNTTGNALEVTASSHSDSLLLLDELGQVDARDLENIIYMLSTNTGKARMNKLCGLRKAITWRLMVLSTGEVTLENKLAEIGKTLQAGIEIRMLNFPAQQENGYGIFEHLHNFSSGNELAEHLKEAASKYYGTAIHAYIQKLVQNLPTLPAIIKQKQKEFITSITTNNGQVIRAARRFASLAVAGELAIEYGVLPLDKEEIYNTIKACFNEWLETRESTDNIEQKKIISQIKNYLERYGSSKFITLDACGDETLAPKPIDRIGYKQEYNGVYHYYVFPESYKNELCKGLDYRQVTKLLAKLNYINQDHQGKNQISKNLPGLGKVRVYHINPSILISE
jgi:putative DNA primase/helicase